TGSNSQLLAERRNEGRGGIVAAGERHVGHALALIQQRQGVQQTQALIPGAKADAGLAQEYPRQGLFRYTQLPAPLLQADAMLGALIELLAGRLQPGIARPR